jgi:HK97 family phage prohead protease
MYSEKKQGVNKMSQITEMQSRLAALKKKLLARAKTKEGIEHSYPIPLKLETKTLADGDWEVSGYVAVFNNVDLTGDLIQKGAFEKSLRSGRKVKFLFNHDAGRPLGIAKTLKEDSRGLFGQFKISKTRLGEEVRELLKDGALDSFSFGYTVRDSEYKGDVRLLREIDIFEASLVSIPANSDAVVTNFKDVAPVSLVEAHKIRSRLNEIGRKHGGQ